MKGEGLRERRCLLVRRIKLIGATQWQVSAKTAFIVLHGRIAGAVARKLCKLLQRPTFHAVPNHVPDRADLCVWGRKGLDLVFEDVFQTWLAMRPGETPWASARARSATPTCPSLQHSGASLQILFLQREGYRAVWHASPVTAAIPSESAQQPTPTPILS